MECDNYLQMIALFATIVSSHWLVSRQIVKNKKSSWIEDLRREISTFTALGISMGSNSTKDERFKIIKSSQLLILLLDENEAKQGKLIEVISSTMILFSTDFQENHVQDFKEKYQEIVSLTKVIISEQTKKL